MRPISPARTYVAKASELFISGAQIWVTNIIVFGLWFWLVDGGDPSSRIAKMLMAIETLISFVTIVLVFARAIGITQ